MKNTFLITLCLLSQSIKAQTYSGQAGKFSDNLTLKDVKVTAFQKDTAFVSDNAIPTSKAVKDYIDGNIEVSKINSTVDFNTYSGKATVLNIPENTRGGIFNLYTGTYPVDNGMIFIDALSRKWKRQITDNKISIKWYGAKGTENSAPNDAKSAIERARDYCYNSVGSILYIPRATGPYFYYYVGGTISFADHDISIEGDNFGASHSTNSILKFPTNVMGFDFNMTFNQARFVTLKNLRLQGGGNEAGTSYTTYDVKKHGIQINANFDIQNVFVTAFSGDGFHITGGNGLGSTNRSVFRNCEGDYCYNGFFTEGNDANTILFDNCSGVQNKRWGFLDNCFLGNTYINCHTATNALLEIRKDDFVKASYNGISYVAINNDDVININFRPDLNPTKWEVYSAQGLQLAWVSTRRYYSGGAYCSVRNNAYSLYENCYSEAYQPPSRFAQRTMILNGLQEAGGSGGASIAANFDAIINHSEVNFEKKVTFGNVYGPTSGIISNQSGTTQEDRYLEVKGNNGLAKGNVKFFADGTSEMTADYLGLKPLLWLNNPNTYQQDDRKTLVVTQNYNFPTGKLIDARSGTLTYNGGLDRFTVFGDGKIKFGAYTSTASFPGTAVANLQVDASGNIITSPSFVKLMTKSERDKIANPTQGMLVFVTDNGGYMSWYNSGWQKVSSLSD